MNDKKCILAPNSFEFISPPHFFPITTIYLSIFRPLCPLFLFPKQILTANINTYSEVENALQPIIMAQKVRIYPYSQYDRTVCLRAELIGCIWDGEFCFPSERTVLALKLRSRHKKFEFLRHPPKFPTFQCVFFRALCGDKVFNLIVETYATQTFPKLSLYFLRVHRNSPCFGTNY